MFSTPIPSQRISLLIASLLFSSFCATALSDDAVPDDGKLRIIVFGAHPDDAELEAGGTAALWASMGHHVKFVSTTNGDIGHAVEAGAQLAVRRIREVNEADKILGVEATEVYDIHDGEIMPTLENRKLVTKSIREWKADIVIAHRPNDYHPDHRYTGILVQDAAFMVIVKSFLPSVPNLTKNPVFLYTEDGFQKPNPMDPQIVVSIDDVIDQKIDALWKLESQIESYWATRDFEKVIPVPQEGPERAKRKAQVAESMKRRYANIAKRFRSRLIELYGKEKGSAVKYAEAFELCEYGRRPHAKELMELFPFFGTK
jgi:LmbE family N-acetylglucosaminyl deacetylase|tara:strand:- start:822 stop:1766 length:945 start_codon:yes stop_codon:yes gene_type:complete